MTDKNNRTVLTLNENTRERNCDEQDVFNWPVVFQLTTTYAKKISILKQS